MLIFVTPWSRAFDLYLWPFVNDFFGVCAASGYKDTYGLDCLGSTFLWSV